MTRQLHDAAMRLAQEAVSARERGNRPATRNLALQALALEREAAESLPRIPGSEPARSTLFLSAASLAFQAGEFAAVAALANEGLAGSPPRQVRDELRAIMKRASTQAEPPPDVPSPD